MSCGLSFRVKSAAALLPFLMTSTTHATWSIVIADNKTKEVAVGTVTCLTNFNNMSLDLLAIVPVVVVGKGAAAVMAAADFDGIRRPMIFDNLIAGVPPENILAIVAAVPGHQSRQYVIVDIKGRSVIKLATSLENPQWDGGVIGSDGSMFYAILGGVLAGGCVVPAIEQAVLTTVGDIPAKLMAGMQAARINGGDGRCSCSEFDPTGCGCPPPDFTKSGHIGGMVVARIGDADDPFCNAEGCADGDYFMRLNVPFQEPGNPDPVVQLQKLFDAWRADLNGRPDAIQSLVAFDPPGPAPDGTSTTMQITPLDWQGLPHDLVDLLLTVEHAPGSDGISTIGPVVDNGDGSLSVVITSNTTGASTDRFRVTIDDGIRPVVLTPDPVLELLGPLPTDDCSLAPTVNEGTFPVSNLGAATDGPEEPLVCDFLGDTQVASDVWLCYTPSLTGLVTASLCGSEYDTKIAVYAGCTCPTDPSATACNNDFCDLQSEVSFPVTPGESFLLRIGGFAGDQGNGTLTITFHLEACCLPDGTCQELTAEDCLAAGGAPQGTETSCGTTSCPPAPPQAELIADAQGDLAESTKNRFLSFTAGDPGDIQAIRVTFLDLPAPFDVWNGATLWVGAPSEVSENGSSVEPIEGFPNFHAAQLQCTAPVFRDFSALGVVHVFHEGIVPGGAYRVQVIDILCPIADGNFADDGQMGRYPRELCGDSVHASGGGRQHH